MATLTTGALLSNYEEALKHFYIDPVKEQLNNDTILTSILNSRANEEDVSGVDAKIDVHYGRSTGVGARVDGGDLPTAGKQLYKQATVPMKYNYGRVQFTGPTIAGDAQR